MAPPFGFFGTVQLFQVILVPNLGVLTFLLIERTNFRCGLRSCEVTLIAILRSVSKDLK